MTETPRMASWKSLFAAAAAAATLSAVPVFADSSTSSDKVTIFSMATVPDWQAMSAMSLQVSAPGADILPLQFTVVPLTAVFGLNQSQETRNSVNIQGELISATLTNYANISGPAEIAYLNCDTMNNASFVDPNRMFTTLMDNLPLAILLYSQTGNCCGLSGSYGAYQSIFTMVDASEAAQTLNITNSGDGVIEAAISGNATAPDSDNGDSDNGSNSAIAMSILYSITGLITLLFLVIIATGAIRAHRYPERYGPRSGYGGRPRQSRAKGIARAVLETLPIVKFGGPNPTKPDPNFELESMPDNQLSVSGAGKAPNDCQVHHLSTIPEDAETQPKEADEPAGNASSAATALSDRKSSIGAANMSLGADDASQNGEEHLGCSICTEDFTVGEDVRVLPCDHKFHPHCVDPWLVNVSGTCPLCRLDLHPNAGEADSSASDGQTRMPPPLDAEEVGMAPAASSGAGQRRRSSRFFDLNRLRHASVEERIEVLRRYRAENQTENSGSVSTAEGEDEHSRAKLTKRLRDKFRIRTRTQSPSSSDRRG